MWIVWLIVGIWIGVGIKIVYDWAGTPIPDEADRTDGTDVLESISPERAIREIEASGGHYRASMRPSAYSGLAERDGRG